MATMKGRPVLAEVTNALITDENITVNQYLENKLNIILEKFSAESAAEIKKIKEKFEEEKRSILRAMQSSTSEKKLCVTLKCTVGSHLGQKFRLEPTTENGEDEFKIGRSTGRLFKEKGVSLYKDKEISTTHAKIEFRNGQAFLVDVNSTNGTLLNGNEIEPLTPLRLSDGDLIGVGNTELQVQVTDLSSEQNDETIEY